MARDPFANPEQLTRQLYAYVAYVLGDGPDAEDVTSEAFERALRYRQSYDPAKGTPIAWLIGIARRCIGPYLAARRDRPGTDQLDEMPAPGGEHAERTVTQIAVRQAVAHAVRARPGAGGAPLRLRPDVPPDRGSPRSAHECRRSGPAQGIGTACRNPGDWRLGCKGFPSGPVFRIEDATRLRREHG